GLWIHGRGGKKVDLHDVLDIAEVAAGFTVTVYLYRNVLHHRRNPLRDHRGVRPLRVLARAEDVEVTQPDRFNAVTTGEYVSVEFVDVFGHGVRRQRSADHLLDLRQAGMVAIDGAARGIHKPLHAIVARGHEHVQKAGNIAGVAVERVLDGTGHRAQRGLMQNAIHAPAGPPADSEVADVPFNEPEIPPSRGRHKILYLHEILLLA